MTVTTDEILRARIQEGRLIEHPEQATEAYLKGLIRTLIVSADTELISAPAYMRAEQRGLSTFEFQLSVDGPLRSGDLVRVQSALVHVGNSSLRLFHRMTNARTGVQVATLEQSGVHLDREARRSVPLPDGLRSKAVAMLALTVT